MSFANLHLIERAQMLTGSLIIGLMFVLMLRYLWFVSRHTRPIAPQEQAPDRGSQSNNDELHAETSDADQETEDIPHMADVA